jgi:hypothetical protein
MDDQDQAEESGGSEWLDEFSGLREVRRRRIREVVCFIKGLYMGAGLASPFFYFITT